MPTVPQTLKQLHQYRQELAEARQQIDRNPVQVAARKNQLAKQTEAVESMRQAIKRLRIEADEKELTLKTHEARVRDLQIKLNQVESNKEYTAIQEEIRKFKAQGGQIEEEVLELITKSDEKSAELKKLEAEVKLASDEFEKFRSVIQYNTEKMTARVGLLEGAIKESEAQLDSETLATYRRLAGIRGERTLAACENGICTACFTGQTPQAASEIASGRVVICKSCGALLYSA